MDPGGGGRGKALKQWKEGCSFIVPGGGRTTPLAEVGLRPRMQMGEVTQGRREMYLKGSSASFLQGADFRECFEGFRPPSRESAGERRVAESEGKQKGKVSGPPALELVMTAKRRISKKKGGRSVKRGEKALPAAPPATS